MPVCQVVSGSKVKHRDKESTECISDDLKDGEVIAGGKKATFHFLIQPAVGRFFLASRLPADPELFITETLLRVH